MTEPRVSVSRQAFDDLSATVRLIAERQSENLARHNLVVSRLDDLGHTLSDLRDRVAIQNGRVGKLEERSNAVAVHDAYRDGSLALPRGLVAFATSKPGIAIIAALLAGLTGMSASDLVKALSQLASP